MAIQEYPIQSAICEPSPGTTLDDSEEVTFKGYAWSGGGRGIIRVDVSIDGGKTWQCADLEKDKQPLHREWAWTIWEVTLPIPKHMRGKQLELVCKAVDTSHNAQPDSIDGIWNLRGLIHNAWHRVKVNVPRNWRSCEGQNEFLSWYRGNPYNLALLDVIFHYDFWFGSATIFEIRRIRLDIVSEVQMYIQFFLLLSTGKCLEYMYRKSILFVI